MNYTKKSEIVDAFKFTGGPDQIDDCTWMIDALKNGDARFENDGTKDVCIMVNTSDGPMDAQVNDYIMKRADGKIYPCGHDIFVDLYLSI